MFVSNKYKDTYYKIINRAISRVLPIGTYIEKHHIIPKSLGGSNLSDNIVALTAKEHFICHLLLTKMTVGRANLKMTYALCYMAGRSSKLGKSHLYNSFRNKYSAQRKEFLRLNGHPRGMLGKKHTEATKLAHSKRMAGSNNPMFNAVRTENWRLTHSKRMSGNNNPNFGKIKELSPNYGKPAYNSGKTNLGIFGFEKASAISQKQSTSAKNKPKIQCPHCNLLGTTGNMKRWHFDNCKEKV